MAEKAVRKTTTKKTVRKTATKAAPKKVASKASPRKAPTSVATQRAHEQKIRNITFAGVGVFIVFIGVSIAIGVSGEGQISIERTVAELKTAASPEERARIESVPVQNPSKKVGGGLVPSGVPVEAPPVPIVVEDNASSSESVASSTDPLPDEERVADAGETLEEAAVSVEAPDDSAPAEETSEEVIE